MTEVQLTKKQQKYLLRFQCMEITEQKVYLAVAKRMKNDAHNKEVILRIAEEESKHYQIWKKYSKVDVGPNYCAVVLGFVFTRILGYTFVLKWMERKANSLFKAEHLAQLSSVMPEIELVIMQDEHQHESAILAMLDQRLLSVIGSIVLGLNDALVEMIGSLAGFTLATPNAKMIAMMGFIMGVAASLSMAASEYLSLKSEGRPNALGSSCFAGIAYITVVLLLIAPYIFLPHHVYAALALSLFCVLMIIFAFNYYVAIVQNVPFWPRFCEMSCISLGVAGISFGIGFLAKTFLHIDV